VPDSLPARSRLPSASSYAGLYRNVPVRQLSPPVDGSAGAHSARQVVLGSSATTRRQCGPSSELFSAVQVRSGLFAMTVSGPKVCDIRGGAGSFSAMHVALGLSARTIREVGKECTESGGQGTRNAGFGNVLNVDPRDVYLPCPSDRCPLWIEGNHYIPLVIQCAVRYLQLLKEFPHVRIGPVDDGIDALERRPSGIAHIPV